MESARITPLPVDSKASRVVVGDPPALRDWEVKPRNALASILLVEDDQAVLDTFARMLRLEGYEVRTANRPEEGLRLAERSRPDALILDFRMPLLDGLGFLRCLRGIDGHRQTPVAIVTGDYFLDDAITAELHDLGAQILFKPLWLEQLVELARALITGQSAQHHS
jgi:two-component system, OmpR family, response regulator PrrA